MIARRVLVLAFAASAFSCASKSEEVPATPALPECPPESRTAPNELRCTGLYSDWTKKTVAAEVASFKPGVELWSDGAEKQRWVLLPKGAKIDTTDVEEWQFPVGTKTWKEFRVNGRRVETRFYWKLSTTEWAWTTYEWKKDEDRADRLDDGRPNAEGNYSIPKVETCDQCHRGRKDKVLGIEAMAMSLPEAQGLTLAKLKQDGVVGQDVNVAAIPEDSTGKARAALAYLHMNCGVACHANAPHSPAIKSGLFLRLNVADLNAGKPLGVAETAIGKPVLGNAYFDFVSRGFLRIKPGVAAESLLPELARIRNQSISMPPVGSLQPDDVGRKAVEDWINALPKN